MEKMPKIGLNLTFKASRLGKTRALSALRAPRLRDLDLAYRGSMGNLQKSLKTALSLVKTTNTRKEVISIMEEKYNISDPTEIPRRILVNEINSVEADRKAMERVYGQVWNTQELQEDFVVSGFMAPFVGVTRKSDNVKGLLMFQDHPRFYFDFSEV